MLIPKKASDELQCLLCGINRDKTSLPMLDCENDNKLLSSIILGLNLQDSINCKKLDLGFIRIVLCFNCHYILKFVNEFRARSLLNIHQLRMKFYHENPELPEGVRTRSTAGVLSTDNDDSNWLRIVNVESQYPEQKFQTSRSPKNSFYTNGYMGRSDISNGSIKSSKHSSRSSKNHNGHAAPESKNGIQGKCNNMVRRSRRLEDHTDDESSARSTESRISLKHELIERFSENDFVAHDEVDFQPGLNDSIDICDNEIRGINYNTRSSPMESINSNNTTPVLQPPPTPVRVHVGRRPSSNQQPFMMPELPLLKVLYATESEPLTETESGGRVDKENTLMGASSRKKSFKCSICDKTMRNELLLKKHLVSKHIHDKRRDMMEQKKKKAADKKFACSTCHSTFRTAYMLKKHEGSHKRLRCEMCNAEYTNPMDFEWHHAKCSGVNRSSYEHTGVWTRSRSRQNAGPSSSNNTTMMDDTTLSEREISSVADDIAAAETLISMERDTPRLLTPPDEIPEENKEHLEKWLEHTTAQLQNRKKGKRGRKKKTKVSIEQSNEDLSESFDENVFVENEAREIESTGRRIARASTPFPSRARRTSSAFDSSASMGSESRASTPASQVSSINLDNWFRNRMDFDNDDSASVCSGYTAISDRSDITARTSMSFASSRQSGSSIGSSNWCARSRDSISTSISLLVNKPRTRNVAKALQKLELELSFCSNRSSVDNASQKSRRRLKKRQAHRRNDDSVNEYWCNDDYCERSYPTLEELMDHEEEAHKLLRLFRCGECKRKFTAKKFLQKHQLDHESGPFMCIYCDFNFTYTHELRSHFELHRMRSVPCDHPGCCKTFLKPVHLAEHQLTYHVKEVSAEEEELFVLEFQRKRALARQENRPIGKSTGILKTVHRRRSGMGASNSATSETEAETQEQYARVLGEMHSSTPIQNLSAPGCSYTTSRDTTGFLPEVAQRIQSQRLSTDRYSSASEVIDTVHGVCDTIMNSDDNVADPKTNEYSTSVEDEGNEQSSRNILVKKRRKKLRITLSSKRHRSKHIISSDHVERDLSFFDHPKYSDISGPDTQDESDVCEDTQKVKPWRL